MFFSCKTFKLEKGVQSFEVLTNGEDSKHFIISDTQGGKYLLDTGSSDSYLDTKAIHSLRKNNYQSKFYSSSVNQQKGFRSETIEKVNFSSFTIKHSRFTHLPDDSPIRKISNDFKGIIGMNILSQKISYWNIKEGVFILGYLHRVIDMPALVLKYQDEKRVPTVNVRIDNIQYRDVLLDTGYYNFLGLQDSSEVDFTLDSFVTLNNDILGNTIQTTTYNTNSITVNGHPLVDDKSFRISVGDFSANLLGYGFFAYWDYFVIDPFRKEFRFYKKEEVKDISPTSILRF